MQTSDFEARAVYLEAVEVAERADGERVRAEELGRDAQEVSGRDALDALDDLLGGDAPAVDYLLPRERARARARRFQPEQDGGDGLVFHQPQLLFADGLAQNPAHLGERKLKHLVELLGRSARVDLEDARVRVVAPDGPDRVGQAALLAHPLPEARAGAAAYDGAEQARGVAVFVARRGEGRREYQVRLLKLLLAAYEDGRGRARRRVGRLGPRVGRAGPVVTPE